MYMIEAGEPGGSRDRGRGQSKPRQAGVPVLVAAGYVNIDMIAYMPSLPGKDQRITGAVIRRELGGMSANLACAAAHLGPPWQVRAELISTVGHDPDSLWVLAELERRGVSTRWIARPPDGRVTYCLILVDAEGDRAIISEPMQFYESKVAERIVQVEDRAVEHERGQEVSSEGRGKGEAGRVNTNTARVLHTEGYWVPQLLPHIKRARELGWLTSIDLDGLSADWQNPQGLMQIAQCFDIVFMNRGTATAVWPDIPRDGVWLHAVEGRLMQIASGKHSASGTSRHMPLHKGARGKLSGAIVLTLGEGGAVLVPDEGAPVRVDGVRVHTVDTTGAGDVFAGTFLAIWLNGGSLEMAGRYACVAAALSTTGRGALGYLPSAEDILSFAPSQLEPVCGADESAGDRLWR